MAMVIRSYMQLGLRIVLVTLGVSVPLAMALLSQDAVGAFAGTGTLFGTDANGGNLITIDSVTGAGTIVGDMGAGVVPSLAVDPSTGIL